MPVFMIGMQRSGSNLLRLMLNQLPGIAAPHPPHILERLGPFESSYGDLHKGSNFEQLVSDVCRLVETNPVKWESVDLDPKAIMDSCRERSLVAVYGAVHDCLARAWGGTDWLCKSRNTKVHKVVQNSSQSIKTTPQGPRVRPETPKWTSRSPKYVTKSPTWLARATENIVCSV